MTVYLPSTWAEWIWHDVLNFVIYPRGWLIVSTRELCSMKSLALFLEIIFSTRGSHPWSPYFKYTSILLNILGLEYHLNRVKSRPSYAVLERPIGGGACFISRLGTVFVVCKAEHAGLPTALPQHLLPSGHCCEDIYHVNPFEAHASPVRCVP